MDFFAKETIGLKYIPRYSARYLQELENRAVFGSFEPELVVVRIYNRCFAAWRRWKAVIQHYFVKR